MPNLILENSYVKLSLLDLSNYKCSNLLIPTVKDLMCFFLSGWLTPKYLI